jgi:hypothetical protein
MVYVSITGLQLKRFYHAPRFWWHAVPAMVQAQRAEGNITAQARTVAGVHHTLTVWTDEAAMRRYMTSGAHLAAMRVFASIATGKTFGFQAETAPAWDEALDRWRREGRTHPSA